MVEFLFNLSDREFGSLRWCSARYDSASRLLSGMQLVEEHETFSTWRISHANLLDARNAIHGDGGDAWPKGFIPCLDSPAIEALFYEIEPNDTLAVRVALTAALNAQALTPTLRLQRAVVHLRKALGALIDVCKYCASPSVTSCDTCDALLCSGHVCNTVAYGSDTSVCFRGCEL